MRPQLLLAGITAAFAVNVLPSKLHFHEPESQFGNPMGVIYDSTEGLFHFWYATAPQPEAGEIPRILRGVVGHATSPDLVNWKRDWQVLESDGGNQVCAIDGGSVVKDKDEYVMYYSERCCPDSNGILGFLRCPTYVRRATSKDGVSWTKDSQSILMTMGRKALGLPSVVYEGAKNRYIMTLVGDYNMTEGMIGYQPTFFKSADGVAFEKVGVWQPEPAAEDEGAMYWRIFRNNHVMHYGSNKYVLMGQRSDNDPIGLVGTIDDAGMFDQDVLGKGRNLVEDWAQTPFPVAGHPDFTNVVMSIFRGAYKHDDDFEDMLTPLTFPISVGVPSASYPDHQVVEYFAADWLPAVRNLINATKGGTEKNVAAGESEKLDPSSSVTDGLFYFGGKMNIGGTLATSTFLEFQNADGDLVYSLELSRDFSQSELKWTRLTHTSERDTWTRLVPQSGEDETEVEIILDHGVAEVRVGEWMSRDRFKMTNGIATQFYLKPSAALKLNAGWSLDPVAIPKVEDPSRPEPTDPPTGAPTEPSNAYGLGVGAGVMATALAALL